MRIRHLNHSCLLVETAGVSVLVDPGSFSAEAVRAMEDLDSLDAILVTHQHADHVDPDLLDELRRRFPDAQVIAEPEAAQMLGDGEGDGDGDGGGNGDGGGDASVAGSREEAGHRPVLALPAGQSHRIGELTLRALGGRHAIIHPDIPRVGNVGFVLEADGEPSLGITGDSLEPIEEFHGIDVLAFAVVAPWSKMQETIDFLRSVRPRLALPVHDAVASPEGRPIFINQSTNLAPEGTEVRDWGADGDVSVTV